VLSSLDKGHLEVWRNKIGAEAADKITNQAKNRGTAIHKLAEDYLMNKEDYHAGSMPINLYDFKNHIKPYLDARVDNILGIEYPLFSKRLKTAGRTDLIADWDGSPAIIDFKTSRKPKREEWIKNYFLQATCYSLMLQERTGIACPDIVILISVDNDEPQVFHKKRKDYLEEVVRIFTQYSA
jgi:genome maintenance exonuclease 1